MIVAARRTTIGSTTYRSVFESRVAQTLPARFAYETVRLSYTLQHTYKPDFIDEVAKEIVEAKGEFDSADRTKMLAIKKAYPEYKITIVFQNPNIKIAKDSKTSYSDWAIKHGFEWTTINR